MKILKVLTLIVAISFLTIACGGGGDGGGEDAAVQEDNTSAPSISNLSYSPKSATLNQGGGVLTVNGSFDFIDVDGDITTLTIRGTEGEISTEIQGISSLTSGTVSVTTSIDTTKAGNFSFVMQVTDATGKLSNTLTGSFTVN